MASRNRPPVSLALLLVGALDCAKEPSRIVIGRLDLVLRPDSTAASSRPVRGSFLLRELERGTHEHVAIDGDPYQTRSVWLTPGSYALEWRPALALAGVLDADAVAASGGHMLSTEQHVVVGDGRVTTVNVRVTVRASAMRDAVAGVLPQ